MKSNNLKSTLIFSSCGTLAIVLLFSSFLVMTSDASDKNVTVEIDNELYDALLCVSNNSKSECDIQKINNDMNVLTDNTQSSFQSDTHEICFNDDELSSPKTDDNSSEIEINQSIDNDVLIIDDDIPLASSNFSDYCYHIIYGDTLSELSLRFDHSVNELATYNKIVDPDLIYAGDDLFIPNYSDSNN